MNKKELVQVWVSPEVRKKIKQEAAKKGIKIYQELESRYEKEI